MSAPGRRAALHVALVLSGFAALAYETSWTRMLHRVFGVGDLAVATVLAAFFVGLGAGSWIASRQSDRIERPGRVYAILETVVAVYAGISPWIIPLAGGAYAAVGADASVEALSAWRLVLSLGILVPPTLLLGATLPVVALAATDRGRWAKGVTGLYVSNTLGAVLGAGLTGLVLVPSFGAKVSMWVAAVASLLAAVTVYLSHRGFVVVAAEPEVSSAKRPEEGAEAEGLDERGVEARTAGEEAPVRGGMLLATTLAAGTGLSALAGEVLWTRLLRTVVHGTTQAFASMLACYLLGIAVGGAIARRLAAGRAGPARMLAFTQVGAAALTVLAMVALPHLVRVLPLWLGEVSFTPHSAGTILAFAATLLLPLALVLGMGLPLAWNLAERADPNAARGSGQLLAANTLGGLVGSLLAGFVLVPSIGVEAALLGVVFVHLIIAGLALRSAEEPARPVRRALALVGPLVAGVLVLLLEPSVHLPFLVQAPEHPMRAVIEGPGPDWRENVAFLREGRSATVTVRRRSAGLGLYHDARPESGFGAREPGFGPELALLGSMPTLFAGETERAMVIGLGGGHSARIVLAGGFDAVDVVELDEAIVEGARLMYEAREVPFPLDDPRARLIVDDARNRLSLADAGTYQAVVSQPSHPWLAGSSALYTIEFFREVERALADDGVFSLWLNLFRIRLPHVRSVVRTLRSVFPHVQGYIAETSSIVFVASRRRPAWDSTMDARLRRIARFLDPFGLAGRERLARALELDTEAAEALGGRAEEIVDDRPLLEFQLAATSGAARVTERDLDRALRDVPWWSPAFVDGWEGQGRVRALLSRVEATWARPFALDRVERTLGHAGLEPAERALIEGALAEARGDVRGALEAWDRAHLPMAALRADALRVAEGMPRRALSVARERDGVPTSAAPLLRAGLQIGTPNALRDALAVATRVDAPRDRPLRAFVRAELEQPCSAWQQRPEPIESLARQVGEVALRAQECAFAAGDRDAATRLGTLAVRSRREAAFRAHDLGARCVQGGNGGCALVMLRRALREYPSHSRSAVALARLHHEGGRPDEARRVLRTTLRATRGIPSSERRLATAAEELEIDLGDLSVEPAGPSPTAIVPERGAPPGDDG
ncbi:MAG TPA: hypothetical protein RMH99_24720 [Sandaracinaceae bacterium LLY-WYZ-13_1]|nr:hypothetical protein [Sandaracinaceae bacterium LLY-WYZ-13_1]